MTNLKPQTLNLEPKARPILFSTPMVQALLDGRKTQTRRVAKDVPTELAYSEVKDLQDKNSDYFRCICPYGKPGDLLWVRETFRYSDWPDHDGTYEYKADMEQPLALWNQNIWKPSIHMPKAAARIWLRITDIRIERVQDITEEDAKAEGMTPGWPVDSLLKAYEKTSVENKIKPFPELKPYQAGFLDVWSTINGLDSWFENPYVWVVSFEVVSTTGKPEFSPKMQTRL